jgi:sugar lactone lactonase YvrE
MTVPRVRLQCISTLLLAISLVLAACNGSATTAKLNAPTATPRPTSTLTPTLGPAHYTRVVVTNGIGDPDDLTLDAQGNLIVADNNRGKILRLTLGGQITTLIAGLPEPEGVLSMPDGSLIFAVQGQNGGHIDQIDRLAPGSTTPTTLITFTNATNSPGLDGLSIDTLTGDILAADSPNGKIYRVSIDGKTRTLLASGFVRPVDAINDPAGNIYVADEYGNEVVRIAPNGTQTRLVHLSDPDDLAFDRDGTLLVTVLGYNTIVRLNPTTGQVLSTVATDLHEPQGLVVDAQGDLFTSEELANIVLELKRG